MKRRRFLRIAGSGAAGSLFLPDWIRGADLGESPGPHTKGLGSRLQVDPEDVHLVILHTNDTHSRIDPFPMDGGPFQGLGGAARRATLIKRVRSQHPNVLLLDSGDIFQGTPYFNFFRGEIEFDAMSAMAYDVATIGNHDFDNGVKGLVEMMPRATFRFVSANYDVSESSLEPFVEPWIVKKVGGVQVGIFGLGIAFQGLVLEELHQGVRHTDPFAAARRCVSELRRRGCSLIVCLSHLGYRYGGGSPSDTRLAEEVEGVDLILGGHSHTFMETPDVYLKPDGRRTLVNQVGWAGMRLGRVDVKMSPAKSENPAGSHQPDQWSVGGYPIDRASD